MYRPRYAWEFAHAGDASGIYAAYHRLRLLLGDAVGLEGPSPVDAAGVRALLDHLHRREVAPDRDGARTDDRVREGAAGRVVGLAALGDLRAPREPDATHGAYARTLDGAAPEHLAAPLEDTAEVAEHVPHPARRRGHG